MSIKRLIKSRRFIKFYKSLERIKDFRQKGKIKHKQADIIIIIILAMFTNCNKFTEISLFASKYEKTLIKLLNLKNGLPSHDTIERTFHRIRHNEINEVLVKWIIDFINPRELHFCIDGKYIRSTRKNGELLPKVNIVTMYLANYKLGLFTEQVEEKSNEIKAIPKLLDKIRNFYPKTRIIVTIDAIAANNTVLKALNRNKIDFCICIKPHHGEGLCSEIIQEFKFKDKENDFDSKKTIQTIDSSNGRVEKRIYQLIENIKEIDGINNWIGVKKVGRLKTKTENKVSGKINEEERYFLMSDLTLECFSKTKRAHWQIENNLHYVLDNSFIEDRMRIKKGFMPANMNTLRQFVMNIINLSLHNENNKYITTIRDKLRFCTPQIILYKILKPNASLK